MKQERMRHSLDRNTEIIFYDDSSVELYRVSTFEYLSSNNKNKVEITQQNFELSEDAINRLEKILKWR